MLILQDSFKKTMAMCRLSCRDEARLTRVAWLCIIQAAQPPDSHLSRQPRAGGF